MAYHEYGNPRAPLFGAVSWKKLWSARGGELVLRLCVEVAGVVTLVQLARRLAGETIDHAPALHGRAPEDGVGPALHMLVILHRKELGGVPIEPALCQTAIPREDSDVGDRVGTAGYILLVREADI